MKLPEFAIILGVSLGAILFFGVGASFGQKTAETEIEDTIDYCQEVRDTSFHDCLHERYPQQEHSDDRNRQKSCN